MVQIAKVTKELTKGFVSVRYSTDNPSPCSKDCRDCQKNPCTPLEKTDKSAFARDMTNCKHGDIVYIKPAVGQAKPISKVVYIMPIVMFVLGYLLGQIKGWTMTENIIAGVGLALITLGISWIMNRRARLMNSMEFEVVRVLRKSLD